ncbi:MAG: esterase family protein [Chloroflexi bacterium]|nr:esterase family protein [Chloroflexota bacterium]
MRNTHFLGGLSTIVLLLVLLFAPAHAQDQPPLPYTSLEEFQAALDAAISSGAIDPFWQTLVDAGQMPLIFEDTAVFLYRGTGAQVEWRGDFSNWESNPIYWGERQGSSDLWMMSHTFAMDTRLDYKIVVGETEWLLDPLNPYQQLGGYGPNSELRMPDSRYPEATIPRDTIAHGELSADQTIDSSYLGYKVNYRVYLPAGYEELDSLPVMYVADGQDFAHDEMGSMVIVLDNLIADGAIQPIIAVFVDPREVGNPDHNRRQTQFLGNAAYAGFLAEELVTAIDTAYKTDPSADARGVLGISFGAVNSTFMAITYPDVFHDIAILSPAFWPVPWMIDSFGTMERLPIKVFLSMGVIGDDVYNARRLRDNLESKGYPLLYVEVNDGHSWGNWRGLLDEVLIYFYGV